MRVLVTGAAGFAGGYLLRELAAAGDEAVAFDRVEPSPGLPAVRRLVGDLLDAEALAGVVRAAAPDACVHLAGFAFAPRAWADPSAAFRLNVLGTLGLLEALGAHAPAARVLVVSTAHVYGPAADGPALREDAPMRPDSPYALSKMAADLATLRWAARRGVHAMTVRPVNHTGPGQAAEYVVAAFARQVADRACGRASGPIRVGNLDSVREFLDVRDVVRGYRLLLARGRAGLPYNLAGGEPVRVGELLRRLCAAAGIAPSTEVDPKLHRPTDASPRLDGTRMRADTGWRPAIPLDVTLRDLYAAAAAAVPG